MNNNFLVLLFVTIFYNGVSHSSPLDGQVSDVKLSEEMPTVSPGTVVDHINKKPDLITKNISQSGSSAAQPVRDVPISKATAPPDTKTKTTNLPTGDVKTETTDAGNKINTHAIDNNSDKSKNQTADVKVTNQTTDNKDATKPAEASQTLSTPVDRNTAENSTATPAGPTLISTASATVTTTTLKPPVSKPTVSTVAPASSTKDNVIAEQNTPAPAQEKHFDGPSFIGGIVLTIGLTAIGFIAFKYYKSGKIDMNYRTL